MRFIKIKNHLINLEQCRELYQSETNIWIYGQQHGGYINFDSEEEAKKVYQKIIDCINGVYGCVLANGMILDLTKESDLIIFEEEVDEMPEFLGYFVDGFGRRV